MKSEAKKENTTGQKDQQQNRNNTRTDGLEGPQERTLFDEPANKDGNGADAQKARRQTSRGGRKSRDNFGSYKGY